MMEIKKYLDLKPLIKSLPIIVLSVVAYVFSHIWFITPQGIYSNTGKAALITIVVFITWTILKLLSKVFWEPYKDFYKRQTPRIIVNLVDLSVILGAVIFITVYILHQSVLSIAAVGGLIGGGLVFALQSPILDAFSSVIIDTQRPFKIGDFIGLPNDVLGKGDLVGKIILSNWRTTTVLTPDAYTITVPNNILTQKGFINYSRPNDKCIQTLKISLDYEFNIYRAERILHAAVLSLKDIASYGPVEVHSHNASEGGVDFNIRYYIKCIADWRVERHKVIAAVVEHVHANGFKISESFGEYALVKGGQPQTEKSIPTIADILKKVKLLKNLSDKELTEISSKCKKLFFNPNDTIIKQGDSGSSMFAVGEGAIEVILEKKSGNTIIKKPIVILGQNEFFGEMSLLLGEKRSATINSKSKTYIIEIPKEAILPTLHKRPVIIKQLTEIVLTKQQEDKEIMSQKHEKVALKSTAVTKMVSSIKKFFGL